MAKLTLRESDFGYKSGDRYYGGLPAEPEYDGPPKRARYWKELHQYFKDKVREYPEYDVIGTSPTSIILRTPDGKETIDLTKFDALADADEAIEMASNYFDESLFEARKKKKNGALVNPDAGNVEHNIDMFNKMNSPVDGPCNNPVSGPFGGDVACSESLDDYVETNELTREEADAASNIDFRIHEEDAVLFIQSGVVDLTTVKEVRYTTTKDDSFDGGYQVILKDGSKKEFGWKDSDREAKLYPLTEAVPPKKETIELEYTNLEFTQYGTKRDVDDWDEWDRCVDWTYKVDKDDLYTFIFESCIDETDFPEAFEDEFDPNNSEHWERFESWLDDNFDTIFSKYEEKILDNWEEDAREQAASDYDPDDYVDWDSMRDDDRYWEDLKEGETVFMESYKMGKSHSDAREPRMIDYFEQMNKEEDEA